jgi:hypothetical protein
MNLPIRVSEVNQTYTIQDNRRNQPDPTPVASIMNIRTQNKPLP